MLYRKLAEIPGPAQAAAAEPRDRIVTENQRAIIDIGSNTVRLVIFGGPLRVPVTLYNEKVTARLGRGVAENGALSAKSMRAAMASLRRYATLLRLRGVQDVECVATAAVRDATNGAAFLARIAELGLSPRLLSGEQEALTGAKGVLAAFPGAQGVVADLGGGSLELTDVGADQCTHGVSMPLGTLRLPQLRAGGADKFARRVRKMLGAAAWTGAHDQDLYLVGGSWRALARYAMDRDAWPVDDPHGYELAPEAALKLARSLMAVQSHDGRARKAALARTNAPQAGMGVPASIIIGGRVASRLEEVPGISTARLASLPDAAALLGVLVRELMPARLIFSSWGLREGLLADRFAPEVRAQDPLVVAASDFVAGLGRGLPAVARQVADWTQRAAPATNPGDEPLRLSATMLALASMRSEPNLRAEQGTDWALRKRWIGVDAVGRAMLAMAVRANNGRSAIPDELLRLAPVQRLREAQAWGLATRLCRRFTGPSNEALAATSLTIEDGRLVLRAQGDMAVLYSDTVARDHRWLAEILGLDAVFKTI
jgi:exopolyphosphatase/guanosine-5'-triphosphate,3'-diphosphate pyrophosphatase